MVVAMDNAARSSIDTETRDALVGRLQHEISRLRAANEEWKAQIDTMAASIRRIGRDAARNGKRARHFRRRVMRARDRIKTAWRNMKERHANELRELRALHAAVEVFQARAHARGEYTTANAVLDAAAAACPLLATGGVASRPAAR
jgi:chromosome segregation ATPase